MYLATKCDTFHNNDDDSSDKVIPDADSKKVTQHHFKLKEIHAWKICEPCVENNVMINVRPCTMTRQGHSVSWESCKICLWEEKLSLC